MGFLERKQIHKRPDAALPRMKMSGILTVVERPWEFGGHVSRAVEALRQADFIAAEDTRVTLKLLNHFEIKTP